ncbi:DHA2 family efflux MFS transporter permease subunit [uncultured Williamsia sp.]|uniref:DHA2 family efflux MFS transporter permease subunit n=1 Tax=uncultured Williamsia sp. TaxID=259311 RepID=UPI00260E36DF|nr:DHA2 family efflux MFS transporter permease subunit [uncultured Williamsia sp.]
MTNTSLPGSTVRDRREPLALAVLCLAAFLASLDVFIVNVAFDAIGKDFGGADLTTLSWVLNAYAIVFAAFLIPAGRLVDRYGRKGGFLLGVGVFTLASVACAVAPGVWWLVAFRVVQALGAAILTPASLGLVVAAARPEHRERSVRIWAATGALAAAFGPVVGGLLVSIDWRWVFLVNVPVGIVAMVGAWLVVPSSRELTPTPFPDMLGAIAAVVGIGGLTLALVEGPDWGWTSSRSLVVWLIAVLALAVFAVSNARHRSPLLSTALFRVRAFAWSNVAALLFGVPFAAGLLVNILWLQQVWGWSAITTGFAVAPGPMMVPIFAAVAHRMAARIPVGMVVAAGCLLFGAGAVLVSMSVGPDSDYLGAVLPGWVIGGIGVGLALPSILSSATVDLPASQAAAGSATVSMFRQVGMVLGVSLVVATVGAPVGYAAAHNAFQHAWWATAGVAVAAALAAVFMTPARKTAATPEVALTTA